MGASRIPSYGPRNGQGVALSARASSRSAPCRRHPGTNATAEQNMHLLEVKVDENAETIEELRHDLQKLEIEDLKKVLAHHANALQATEAAHI